MQTMLEEDPLCESTIEPMSQQGRDHQLKNIMSYVPTETSKGCNLRAKRRRSIFLRTMGGPGTRCGFPQRYRIEVTTLPSRSLFHAAEVQQPPSIYR